jgi:putative nucleotidyltransferase with HDIG domain
MLRALSESAGIAIENTRLFKDLQEAYVSTVRLLVSRIEEKDPYTHGHTERVADYSALLASAIGLTEKRLLNLKLACMIHDIGKIGITERILHKPGRLDHEEQAAIMHHPVIGESIIRPLKGLVGIAKAFDFTPEEVQRIQFGAFLHDIGKVHTEDHVLHKPGALTDDEWKIVKMHPVRGAEMVRGVRFLERCVDMIRHHHERVDGKGYPDGLTGDEMTLAAKIVNVADAFDAMTSDRPYRRALSVESALRELKQGAGTQFDADVVGCLLRLEALGEFPLIPSPSSEELRTLRVRPRKVQG